jgi:hypothetical protein
MKLTTLDIERMRKLRYQDGLSSPKTAEIIGCSPSAVRRYAPGRPGKVPNDKLRAAFLASGHSAAEVARRLGWTYARTWQRANGTRVPYTGADGARVKHALGAETADLMAEAIGVMPWEVMPDEDDREAA